MHLQNCILYAYKVLQYHTLIMMYYTMIVYFIFCQSTFEIGGAEQLGWELPPPPIMERNPPYYGGPEGPCPLPISLSPITIFEFSIPTSNLDIFLTSNFEFSHYQLSIGYRYFIIIVDITIWVLFVAIVNYHSMRALGKQEQLECNLCMMCPTCNWSFA
jgi:hypothetical protein